MKKNNSRIWIILGIIAIVFSVIAFAVPFPKEEVFWIAYAAELIAIVLQVPIFKTAYDNAIDLKSRVLGFPVFRVGYIYLGIQTVLSLALFGLGFIDDFPVWIGLILCVIVLAAALICSISVDMARNKIVQIESVQSADTMTVKQLRTRSENLINKTSDTELRSRLEKLAESFRYSDPVSNANLYTIEQNLMGCFSQLETAVMNGNSSDAAILCQQVENVLNDRNNACKNSK